ncbi:metallophosphoesterase [Herpetosiphon llansteffanensis]|uniref:metallophosphoesterase n=1 Tax=Herpetosiphon llansteffanensis TaxID=2094568 RepID=UPI000D7BC847|nr:metallophosphoesterase [Herpetosiphon llansteffanensis]
MQRKLGVGLLGILLWLGGLALLGGLFGWNLDWLKEWQWLAEQTGWRFWLAQVVFRVLLFLPLLLGLLLLLHPLWLGRRLLPTSKANSSLSAVPLAHETLNRRRFVIEAGLLGGLVGYSSLIEPFNPEIVELELPIANLPSRFEGFKIVQLSDLHVCAFTPADDVARAVALINRLDADIVTITGDFVDRHAKFADDATIPLRQLQAREGIFSVLGNHDYYTGDIERMIWAIKRADLGLLINQQTVIRRGAERLNLVGLDDPKHNAGNGWSHANIDLARAFANLRASDPCITLLHNPIFAPSVISGYAPQLVLSGHTHGGQIWVPILTESAVRSRDRFVEGRYQLATSQIYVNRGWGFTGPPLRFAKRPEISVIRLVGSRGSGVGDRG